MPGRWGKGPEKWWHGEFRGCGYRITIPRQIILQVLDESKEHLSAEDIFLKVHNIYYFFSRKNSGISSRGDLVSAHYKSESRIKSYLVSREELVSWLIVYFTLKNHLL